MVEQKSIYVLESAIPGFIYQLNHLLAVWPWLYLINLSESHVAHFLGQNINTTTSCKDSRDFKGYKVSSVVPGT